MSFSHGSKAYISIGGTAFALYSNESDLAHSKETAAVTAYGDEDHVYIAGLKDGQFSLSGHFHPTADAKFAEVFDTDQPVSIIYGPQGNGAGAVSKTASFFPTAYNIQAPIGDKTAFTSTWQRTGPTVTGTF